MADSVELPNVDIFDPVMCARRWAQCATQQEINVYLNKQIDINRTVLKDTIDAQNAINAASKTKLADHDTRIAALESEVKKLDTAQTNLNAAFQALQTDNNNFKSNVDLLLNQYQTTINLLQQNIDKISTSNEQLWNEVNNLKSQFDPDKLDAAISGYDSLLKDTKAYTDAEAAKLKTQIDGVASDLQNINASLQQMINDNNITWNSNFDSYRNQINADLEQQNQRITAFIQNTDNVLQAQRTWLTNEIARVDKRIDSLTDKVTANKTASDNADTALSQRIDREVEQLNQQITDLGSAQTQVIEGNRQDSEDRDTALGKRIDATNENVSALETSDGKQWDTINAILEANNKIVKDHEAFVKEYAAYVKQNDQDIADLKSGVAGNTNAIANLQTALESGTLFNQVNEIDTSTAASDSFTMGTSGLVCRWTVTAPAVYNNCSINFDVLGDTVAQMIIPAVEYGRPRPLPLATANIVNPSNTDSNICRAYAVNFNSKSEAIVYIVWFPTRKVVKVFTKYGA